MVAMEEGFGYQPQYVVVGGGIEDAVPVAPGGDHTGQPQLGEMLGNRRRSHTDVVGQVAHRMLTVEQRPDQVQPGSVGEQFEQYRSSIELCIRRLRTYLRSHADT